MSHHDPEGFATALSAKLATRSRHVCAFLGAGAGRACGLPDLAGLKDQVLAALDETDRSEFKQEIGDRNLEQGLSRLRRLAALLGDGERLGTMTAARARELDAAVCSRIAGQLSLDGADLRSAELFAAWAAHSTYLRPLEIFTINYDLLLETALERRKVPYFDGFIGSLKAKFYTELVEGSGEEQIPSFFVRLWKMHGSVNWLSEDNAIFRVGHPVAGGSVAAIYPSDEKYEQSRRVPFLVLQDRFRRSLHEPETLVIISGYSFGDPHLNEFIFEAARRRERSEFVVFCYGEIPPELAAEAEQSPNIQAVSKREAILGGIRAEWRNDPAKPSKFWIDDGFSLHDFKHLARFLALITLKDSEVDV